MLMQSNHACVGSLLLLGPTIVIKEKSPSSAGAEEESFCRRDSVRLQSIPKTLGNEKKASDWIFSNVYLTM